MKQYIQNLQAKTPHEQRMHAVRLSAGITLVVFFVWLTATGVQLSLSASGPSKQASDAASGNQTTLAGGTDQNSQLANVVSAVPTGLGAGAGDSAGSGNSLVVATSTQ